MISFRAHQAHEAHLNIHLAGSRGFAHLLVAAFLLLPQYAVAKKAFPPIPNDAVYNERQISSSDQEQLSQILRAFREQSGTSMAIALFKSLEGEDIDEYSNALYRHWCGPDKKSCAGVLLVVAFEERRYRTEVGYGLESTLTDVYTAQVQRELLVPALRAGQPAVGIARVSAKYFEKLTGKSLFLESGSENDSRATRRSNYSGAGAKQIYYLILFLLLFAGPLFRMLGFLFIGHTLARRRRGIFWGGGWGGGSGWGGGGFGGGGGGFGGFSGGGSGSSGGGGSSGSW